MRKQQVDKDWDSSVKTTLKAIYTHLRYVINPVYPELKIQLNPARKRSFENAL